MGKLLEIKNFLAEEWESRLMDPYIESKSWMC